MEDLYRNLGPLQWDGPGADSKALTLCVEDQDYMGPIKKRQEYLDKEKKKKEHTFLHSFLQLECLWYVQGPRRIRTSTTA